MKALAIAMTIERPSDNRTQLGFQSFTKKTPDWRIN